MIRVGIRLNIRCGYTLVNGFANEKVIKVAVTRVGDSIRFEYPKLPSMLFSLLPAWDESWAEWESLIKLELKSPSNITFFLLIQILFNRACRELKKVVDLGGRYKQPIRVDWERIVMFNHTASNSYPSAS